MVVDTTGENSNEPQIAVIRYLPDGRLDKSFNGQGWVLYNNNYLSFASDVAIQKDGKIVVAGFRSQSGQNGYNVILLRFNSFGETDTTFGNGGEIDIPNNVSFDGVNTVASLTIQGDGKILLATHAGAPGSDSKKLLLLRFEKNGIPDESFGSEGRVEYTEYIYGNPAADGFSSDNIMGRKVKIAPDGTINVLVKVFAYTIVLKYDIQGVLLWESMPFCGPTGCAVENSVGGLPRGMEVQPDGKIVIVGEAGTLPFVLRYTPDGNLDSAFGNGSGVVYFNYRDHFGYSDDPVRSSNPRNVAIQQDGSILMVGSCPMNHDGDSLSDDMDVFVARYLSNGTADASFGVNGVIS
ncbi:MAG: delta-60 repeat domain-containing protein, partial [Candidatus Cloacimonadaceae bacterium]|nr:delta-60 repeat domain-containing protein [Candidatus Cloacimonadaceae bacterium]